MQARNAFLAVVAAVVLNPPAVPAMSGANAPYPPVSLRGTQTRTITSTAIGQEFTLHIYLPAGYGDSARTFPAVYLTDSDAYFGFVRSLAGNLHYGGLIPEVVIIGIAYEEDVHVYLRKRERDLLPAEVPDRPGSGNAEMFLAFLKADLLPFVESRYRVDPGDRTIMGMSAGATFASYVLCTSPELFRRYVIVSPYFLYGQEVVLEMETAYAREHVSLPASVYTAMGELEAEYALGPWRTLFDRVEGRHYDGLRLRREVLDGKSHMDVVFTAYVNGMKAIFSDGSRTVPALAEHYESCAGRYELASEGIRFTIRLDRDRLYISRSGQYWDELIPAGDTEFGVPANADVKFSFEADRDGNVTKMIIHQLGMNVPAEKIE